MTSDLEEFQKAHGQQWGKILGMSSFNAGMIHLAIQAMEGIRNLSDDEITRNAAIILSDLRGRLRHESELLSLPVIVDEPVKLDELAPDYPDAQQEAYDEFQRAELLAKKGQTL